MLLATTFTLCPLLTAAPDGVDTLGQSSRETTNFVPHPADFHLMIHSTQHLGRLKSGSRKRPHRPPPKIFGTAHS